MHAIHEALPHSVPALGCHHTHQPRPSIASSVAPTSDHTGPLSPRPQVPPPPGREAKGPIQETRRSPHASRQLPGAQRASCGQDRVKLEAANDTIGTGGDTPGGGAAATIKTEAPPQVGSCATPGYGTVKPEPTLAPGGAATMADASGGSSPMLPPAAPSSCSPSNPPTQTATATATARPSAMQIPTGDGVGVGSVAASEYGMAGRDGVPPPPASRSPSSAAFPDWRLRQLEQEYWNVVDGGAEEAEVSRAGGRARCHDGAVSTVELAT